MAELNWQKLVEAIQDHVVRISTPLGSGTGFLISNAKNNEVCGVATAAHVVNHAHYWEEPIRIDHYTSGKSVLIRPPERAVFVDASKDTAALLFNREIIPFPAEPLPLAPKGKYLAVGNDVGWVGFPAIAEASLCFFGGRVSAWLQEDSAYLVDGVAINGVSGGPAFVSIGPVATIMGVVSAYMPNRATGETLPGLGVIRDVVQFHELAPTFASLDQAKAEETTPSAPPPPPAEPQDATPSSARRTA